MNRNTMAGWCLVVLVIATPAGAAKSGSGAVSSAQLKSDGLTGGAQGKLALVGFSWAGPVDLFADGFAAAGLTPPAGGGKSFQIAAKGPVAVCQGLNQAAVEKRSLGRGRLVFQGGDGVRHVVKLNGLSVGSTDCDAKPWTAAFAATGSKPAEPKAGKAKKTEGKGKAAGR